MGDDFKRLWAEFDLQMLTNPQGVDQFIFALIIVGILTALAFVAIKLILDLLR